MEGVPGGKGAKPRPIANRQTFADNWDTIFAKNTKVEEVKLITPQEFCKRLLDPEDLGWAVTSEVRQLAREALKGMQ